MSDRTLSSIVAQAMSTPDFVSRVATSLDAAEVVRHIPFDQPVVQEAITKLFVAALTDGAVDNSVLLERIASSDAIGDLLVVAARNPRVRKAAVARLAEAAAQTIEDLDTRDSRLSTLCDRLIRAADEDGMAKIIKEPAIAKAVESRLRKVATKLAREWGDLHEDENMRAAFVATVTNSQWFIATVEHVAAEKLTERVSEIVDMIMEDTDGLKQAVQDIVAGKIAAQAIATME